MKKIKDHKIGDKYAMSLLVKNGEQRLTKAKKPFMFLELSDGEETILANVWDWTGPERIAPGTILDLEGSITEFPAGVKQLKVDYIQQNKTLDPSAFAPIGSFDVDEYMQKAYELAGSIDNEQLRDLVLAILKRDEALWRTIPGAKTIHHAYKAGTLKHSVDVAIKSAAIGAMTPMCSVDLCKAGGLIHDYGKLWSYQFNGAIIETTTDGDMHDHISVGIRKLESYRTIANSGLIDLLQHIIGSHHGKPEWGSPVTPRFIEAWIVHLMDMLDAKTDTIYSLNKNARDTDTYTNKDYSLENRAMFTQTHVIRTMLGYED